MNEVTATATATVDMDQKVVVELTLDQWSFICSGLKDLATHWTVAASRSLDTEDVEANAAIAVENLALAGTIEKQVFTPKMECPENVFDYIYEGNDGNWHRDMVSTYWESLNAVQQQGIIDEYTAFMSEMAAEEGNQ